MRLLTLLAIAAAAIALTGCDPAPEASNDPASTTSTSPKSTTEKTGTAPTPAPEGNVAAPKTR